MCARDVLLPKKGCNIYSLGSNGDTSFERGILERAPQCQFHVCLPFFRLCWLAHPQLSGAPLAIRPCDLPLLSTDASTPRHPGGMAARTKGDSK